MLAAITLLANQIEENETALKEVSTRAAQHEREAAEARQHEVNLINELHDLNAAHNFIVRKAEAAPQIATECEKAPSKF